MCYVAAQFYCTYGIRCYVCLSAVCVFCLLLFPSYVQVFQVDQYNLTDEITCQNVFCLIYIFIYKAILS